MNAHPQPSATREMHVSRTARDRYGLEQALFSLRGTALLADIGTAQRAAARMNEILDARRFPERAVHAGELYAAGLLHELLHLLIRHYREAVLPSLLADAAAALSQALPEGRLERCLRAFLSQFPPTPVYQGELTLDAYLEQATEGQPNRHLALEEVLLLHLANQNPALERFADLFDDRELRQQTEYPELIRAFQAFLAAAPKVEGMSLFEALRAPALSSPTSLAGQLEYLRRNWQPVLGARFESIFTRLLQSLDVLKEEQKGTAWPGPGPAQVLTFTDAQPGAAPQGKERPAPPTYERFSPDSSWMPRVVMLAKSTYVWLDQLSKRYQRSVQRLDQIPDEELDELSRRGFTALWLIGLWERSEASRRIKHLRGNPDAVASAYALYDYVIARELGGEEAYDHLRRRAQQRGIRLASDMVPNHVGIDGKWVIEKPDYFLQLAEPPYPSYTFSGPDLSSDERVGIFLEDHYWDSSDAAVVFKRLDRFTGEARYIYHGNDGTTFPWNDTAQLNYLNPEAREAIIQTILHVARKFPIIRFDAAMTLAKQHIQRLWFPEPGEGGAIPSRAQHGSMPHEVFEQLMPEEFWRQVVDRVAQEVPDTLLLAEAFWMMEPYFVRTLGMHRVYNSAFMHMFKNEENAKYRQSIKNTLEFEPEILKRFVNFMNNPDEETALKQFGKDDKYFGVCVVMVTLPGLPMFGHGQVEGFSEKYGMEYQRAKLDEQPDDWLIARHEREIFPLLHRRREFAEVEAFTLYDVYDAQGQVNENVFAYSNRYEGKASLVLYNNAYESASGWIRRSAAYKDRSSGTLRQRDLSEALGLQGGEGRFVVLREHMSGLEYLHSSAELAERGLQLELGGYQYRVFTDIEERRDEDGRLAELCRRLGGRGVPSLDEALADEQYAPLYQAHTRLLEALADEEAAPQAAFDAFLGEVKSFGLELAPSARKALLAALVADARALHDVLNDLPDATAEDASSGEAEDGLQAYLELLAELQPAWLAGRLLGHLAEAQKKTKPALGEALRLAPYWQRALGSEGSRLLELWLESGAAEARVDGPTAVEADEAETETEEAEEDEAGASAARNHLGPLLERDAVRDFLRVNEHEGVLWFDQRAYRVLTVWLALKLWLEQADGGRSELLELLRGFALLEQESAYRLERLAAPVQEAPEVPSAAREAVSDAPTDPPGDAEAQDDREDEAEARRPAKE